VQYNRMNGVFRRRCLRCVCVGGLTVYCLCVDGVCDGDEDDCGREDHVQGGTTSHGERAGASGLARAHRAGLYRRGRRRGRRNAESARTHTRVNSFSLVFLIPRTRSVRFLSNIRSKFPFTLRSAMTSHLERKYLTSLHSLGGLPPRIDRTSPLDRTRGPMIPFNRNP